MCDRHSVLNVLFMMSVSAVVDVIFIVVLRLSCAVVDVIFFLSLCHCWFSDVKCLRLIFPEVLIWNQ